MKEYAKAQIDGVLTPLQVLANAGALRMHRKCKG